MSAICRSTIASAFQSPGRSHTRQTKFSRISRPRSVCVTSGWNCTAQRPRSGAPKAANSQSVELAQVSKPSGSAVTLSP